MKNDPVLNRIREARHRISAQCGHDPRKLVQYYIKLQEQSQHKLASKRRVGRSEAETHHSQSM